jgi:hypothetical protein
MGNLTGAGRPPKKGEDSKTVRTTMRIRPSEKEILKQEAKRCGAPVNRILETMGMEAIWPTGRRFPVANVHGWLIRKAETLQEIVEESSPDLFTSKLQNEISELRLRASDVQATHDLREELRGEARSETAEEFQSVRLLKEDWTQVTDRANQIGEKPTGLLRVRTLQKIEEREMLEDLVDWIGTWKTRIEDISESQPATGGTERARKEVLEVAKDIQQTIETEIFGTAPK